MDRALLLLKHLKGLAGTRGILEAYLKGEHYRLHLGQGLLLKVDWRRPLTEYLDLPPSLEDEPFARQYTSLQGEEALILAVTQQAAEGLQELLIRAQESPKGRVVWTPLPRPGVWEVLGAGLRLGPELFHLLERRLSLKIKT
jgi:hypothetical protein